MWETHVLHLRVGSVSISCVDGVTGFLLIMCREHWEFTVPSDLSQKCRFIIKDQRTLDLSKWSFLMQLFSRWISCFSAGAMGLHEGPFHCLWLRVLLPVELLLKLCPEFLNYEDSRFALPYKCQTKLFLAHPYSYCSAFNIQAQTCRSMHFRSNLEHISGISHLRKQV